MQKTAKDNMMGMMLGPITRALSFPDEWFRFYDSLGTDKQPPHDFGPWREDGETKSAHGLPVEPYTGRSQRLKLKR